ncbi:MAG: UDP-glucose 6-dehydrogenase, partial [Burkholderiales bacterium]|nr:UDP-glucose 6-dehydrogenase [Burkholderiales bacterium]
DMREASSRVLLRELVSRGAHVAVFDPVAMTEARRVLAQDLEAWGGLASITFAANPMDALQGAAALSIVTEWSHFSSPDFEHMARLMQNKLIFDGRNLFEPHALRELGFEYHAIGRAAQARVA